ncbi:MAG: amidophosphoribosyltransferase [Cytophagales bacterium]|tara:strand:+ start:365 stop:2245 length:1881 start_codon:yes stop_codon:yes gene_type:complete
MQKIKHECGIAFLRLRKPVQYFIDKYKSPSYAVGKMFLMMHKQRNRGQDGAGIASLKLDTEPGKRYISRYRSVKKDSIQDIFNKINKKFDKALTEPKYKLEEDWIKENVPFTGEVWLGHLRYGTFGGNSIENCAPTLRQNNWKSKNLIFAGNFNMTNLDDLFQVLVELGQSPKEKSDTVTILEKVGHFLDEENNKIFNRYHKKIDKKDISGKIESELNLVNVLESSFKDFDGGYALAGLVGHGSSFVARDPSGIRPLFYYANDEVVVATSERPPIKTAFQCDFSEIKEVEPGHALIINKDGSYSMEKFIEPRKKQSCSFERIYFSRGNDPDIYKERKKLGELLLPQVFNAIDNDLKNTIFSYIPNTSETCFYGMIDGIKNYLTSKKKEIFIDKKSYEGSPEDLIYLKTRIEKLVSKDVKMRTFITHGDSRNELVSNVYDTTYGIVRKNKDSIVIIDDSIVRGTTLEKSILTLLSSLEAKKVIFVSSSPQIRYPDCYGIDMSKMNQFVAFRGLIRLIKLNKKDNLLEEVYQKCKRSLKENNPINHVKELYDLFTYEEISDSVSEIVKPKGFNSELKIIYQTIENLNKACPNHLGDWYFTGNYPTSGGNRVANRSFMNYCDGISERAY